MQSSAVPASPSIAIAEIVRGLMLFFGFAVIANFTVLNDHMILGGLAWVVFLGAGAVSVAGAAGIVLLDGRVPTPVRVERTRRTGVLTEVAIAGLGALMFLSPALYVIATTSQEVWAGVPREGAGLDVVGAGFTALVGLLGFFMVFWRPRFVIDSAARTIVRLPFGRSLPILGRALPYDQLGIYADSGPTLSVVRGRIGKYTCEFETHYGQSRAVAEQRARDWAMALNAEYWNTERAVAAEMAN